MGASTATATVSTTTEAAGLAILTDKDGTSMKLGVLEFANGTGGFGWLLVDDDAAALGTAVVSLENVSLFFEEQFITSDISLHLGQVLHHD